MGLGGPSWPQVAEEAAERAGMDITNSSSVAAAASSASNSTPGEVGAEASLLVLRKALDAQEAGAAELIAALPQPALATSGSLGRHLNAYA